MARLELKCSFIFGILFVLSQTLALPEAGSYKRCSVSNEKADQCLKRLMTIRERGQPLIRSMDQVKDYCEFIYQQIDCLETHSKCIKAIPRQVFVFFIRRGKSEYHRKCSREGRKEMLGHMKCLDEDTVEGSNRCMDSLVQMIRYIRDDVRRERHIQSICCAFHVFRHCLFNNITKSCPQTALYVDTVVSNLVGDVVRYGCGDRYGSKDGCRKNEPIVTFSLETIVGNGSSVAAVEDKADSESVYFPLVDIYRGLFEA